MFSIIQHMVTCIQTNYKILLQCSEQVETCASLWYPQTFIMQGFNHHQWLLFPRAIFLSKSFSIVFLRNKQFSEISCTALLQKRQFWRIAKCNQCSGIIILLYQQGPKGRSLLPLKYTLQMNRWLCRSIDVQVYITM